MVQPKGRRRAARADRRAAPGSSVGPAGAVVHVALLGEAEATTRLQQLLVEVAAGRAVAAQQVGRDVRPLVLGLAGAGGTVRARLPGGRLRRGRGSPASSANRSSRTIVARTPATDAPVAAPDGKARSERSRAVSGARTAAASRPVSRSRVRPWVTSTTPTGCAGAISSRRPSSSRGSVGHRSSHSPGAVLAARKPSSNSSARPKGTSR